MRSILNLIIAAILYLSLIAAHPQPLNAQLLDHNALITELQQHRSHTTALIEQTKAVKERIANMEEAQACSSAEDSIGERLQLPMKETVLEWHIMLAKAKWYELIGELKSSGFAKELEAVAKLWAEVEKAWKGVEDVEGSKTVEQSQQVVVEDAEL